MALELAGAETRRQRERENVWFSAMLPYLEKPPTLADFLGVKLSPADRAKAYHAAWDRIDQALERGKGRAKR